MSDFEDEFAELAQTDASGIAAEQRFDDTNNLHYRQLLTMVITLGLPIPSVLQGAILDPENAELKELQGYLFDLTDIIDNDDTPDDIALQAQHDFDILYGFDGLVGARAYVIYGSGPNDDFAVEGQYQVLGTVLGSKNVTNDEKLIFLDLTNAYLEGYVDPFIVESVESETPELTLKRVGQQLEAHIESLEDPENSAKFKAVGRDVRVVWQHLIGNHDELERIIAGTMLYSGDILRRKQQGEQADFTYIPPDVYKVVGGATYDEIVAQSGLEEDLVREIIDMVVASFEEIGFKPGQ